MADQCIMCDQRAGSREHVFPAAFGGRRIDRGIYCEKHNNDLGVHVTALLDSLAFFNARLGVRSDHHDAPKPHVVVGQDGERYQILKDHIEIAPPLPLTQTPELLGKPVELKFSSEAQRDRWLGEQRKLGFEVKFNASGPVVTQYFTEPLHLSPRFGTEEFLRAVAYVGLTYLAHYFPAIARQKGLDAVKSYVLGTTDGKNRVWWVDPARFPFVIDPSFRNMHTAVVAVSQASAKATALVSFFGKLLLAVDLGNIDVAQTQCVTTHIDPLAERAGRDVDITVQRESDVEIVAGTAEEGRDYLHAVVGGASPNPVSEILAEMQVEHLNALVSRLRPELEAAMSLPQRERQIAILSIVDNQSQRVLNLLSDGVNGFIKSNNDLPQEVRQGIGSAIAADPATPTGLSSTAIAALTIAKTTLAAEILRQLEAGTLSDEELMFLLAGGAGVALVTRPVLYAVLGISDAASPLER